MAFPTIYRRGTEIHNPVVADFKDTVAHDPTIRSQSEGGFVTSRARFTRIPRKWTVAYTWLSVANKDTLKDYEEAQNIGSASFSWTNPEDSTVYRVRFLGMAEYDAHDNTNLLFWKTQYILEQL